jgi:hypothetical protein
VSEKTRNKGPRNYSKAFWFFEAQNVRVS